MSIRLHSTAGDGVLGRQGDLIVLCSVAPGSEDVVDQVLGALEQTAHGGGDGSALADRIAEVARGVDYVAFAPTPHGLAISVVGHAWAVVATEYGEQRLALPAGHEGVRSVLPGGVRSIRAGLGNVDTDAPVVRWNDLRQGTARAGGLLLAVAPDVEVPTTTAVAAPAAASTPPPQAPPPPPQSPSPPSFAPPPQPAAPAPAPPPETRAPAPGRGAHAAAEHDAPAPVGYGAPAPAPAPARAPAPSPAPAPAPTPDLPPPPPHSLLPQPADAGIAAPPPDLEPDPPAFVPAPAADAPPPVAVPVEAPAVEPAQQAPPAPAAQAPAPPAPQPDGSAPTGPPQMASVAVPDVAVDRSQPFASIALFSSEALPPDETRTPLPVVTRPTEPPIADAPIPTNPVADDAVEIVGVYCKNGHFDDPSARYCAICGISMAQQTLIPRRGPRPPLGVLVLDDGSIFTLDSDYVIGRDPSRDPDVVSGAARPLRIDDPEGLLSRVHARIHLDGWAVQVIDLGSANGTGIWGPNDTIWQRAPVNSPQTMKPGTQVGIGRRQMRYESHRNT